MRWCSDDSHREYKARLLVARLELLSESLLERKLKPLKERCGMELIDGKDGRTWERHIKERQVSKAHHKILPHSLPYQRVVNEIECPKF